jgi:hypothetical protein
MTDLSVRIPQGNWLGRTVAISAAMAALAFTTACSETSAVTSDEEADALLVDETGVARIALGPGLEQTVQLEPKRLHPGDDLRIRSVIRNTSNEYKKAEALVCQLEIRTDMNFEVMEPLILCFAYSATVRLAPNDSLVLTAAGKVKSRPGRYTMVVRHLLRPPVVTRLRVNVYPRLTTDVSTTGE